MPNDKLPTPDRVLVVAAHPDDIEFGAAGTVARWIDEGATVRYLVMTRGDKGSDDPAADPVALGRLREDEQRAAATEIGVAGVDFLDEPDGQVEPSLRVARASHLRDPLLPAGDRDDPRPDRALRQQRMGQPPRPPGRGAGRGRCRLPDRPGSAQLPEQLDHGARRPWKVAELYLWSTNEANQLVDIGDTLDRRLPRPPHHASQFRDFDETLALAAPPGRGARRARRLPGRRGLPPGDAGPMTSPAAPAAHVADREPGARRVRLNQPSRPRIQPPRRWHPLRRPGRWRRPISRRGRRATTRPCTRLLAPADREGYPDAYSPTCTPASQTSRG